jgi:uncharacterized protein with PQ loop repeat
MNLIEIPLIVALVSSALINFPQLYKTWRTHDVESFSVYTMVLRIINNIGWIVYATLIQEWVILAMSCLNALSELTLLGMKQMWAVRETRVLYNTSTDQPVSERHV